MVADALLLLTEWSEFRIPSWDVVGKLIINRMIFDVEISMKENI
jgi:UDPglucose 6-dehydrogenase